MLAINKTITLHGRTEINDMVAETYYASISTDNPSSMVLTSDIKNSALRKENKDECRANRSEFEDEAYALQNELLEEEEKSDVGN